MNDSVASPRRETALFRVSHVAEAYRCYPGETAAFCTRVEVGQRLPGFTLRVTVPPGLVLGDYRILGDRRDLDQTQGTLPLVTQQGEANHLIWTVDKELSAPATYEFRTEATVAPVQEDQVLESRAVLSSLSDGEEGLWDEETVTVAVSAKGRYLNYLPAIYAEDELMGRFLMLFESFWSPINRQLGDLALYFDPQMTPPGFLPWLASWIDLELDEQWPERKRRELLSVAAALYRKRGTRQGLKEYLEIYTGGQVSIVEHRAHNFRLGPEARLGPGVALGTTNVPHTFSVSLHLPPGFSGGDPAERERREVARRRKIVAIIESEKPAHTAYNLHLEIASEGSSAEPDSGE